MGIIGLGLIGSALLDQLRDQRSSSSVSSRGSDQELLVNLLSSSEAATLKIANSSSKDNLLPLYYDHRHPSSDDLSKKNIFPYLIAENAVHLIPLLIIFCIFVLWDFSDP